MHTPQHPAKAATAALPRILFVCTGNICRSPTAHALLEQKAKALGVQAVVDSAGISNEEEGNPMDARSRRELLRRGYQPLEHLARPVQARDFLAFDLLIGMTRAHCAALQRQRERLLANNHPADELGQVHLMLDFLPHAPKDSDVPDPWYGGEKDFITVFDMLEQAVDALMQTHGLPAARSA